MKIPLINIHILKESQLKQKLKEAWDIGEAEGKRKAMKSTNEQMEHLVRLNVLCAVQNDKLKKKAGIK